MKLLILYVSEHRDANLVQSIWNQIFENGEQLGLGVARGSFLAAQQWRMDRPMLLLTA
jgi:hypothetical protein